MLLSSKNKEEGGFTLLEIIAVVAVMAILSAIAVMSFGDQKRVALESTVQADLATNVPLILTAGERVFTDTEAFAQTLIPSNQNTIGVKTTGTFDKGSYCIYVSHKFLTDTYYRHYDSVTGDFVTGDCPDGDNEAILPPLNSNPDPIENPGNGGLEGTPPDAEFEINEKYTEGNITYTPRYVFNSFNTTGTATISVEIKSTGDNLEEWNYVADMKKAPYFNADSTAITFNDGQGKLSFANDQMSIKAVNIWNGVSKNRSVTVTYNLTRYNPPVASSKYDVVVEKAPGGSQWHACLNVKVTGKSEMPVRWEYFVDLKKYFASIQGKPAIYQNLKETISNPDNPYFAKIEGNGTNNNLVSNTHHAMNSQTICYNPNGSSPYL